MPLDVFTDSDTVTVLGPMTLSKNPMSGADGNLTVNGATGISTTAITTTGATTLGTTVALKQNSGTAPTIASSGTITTAGLAISRVTTGGAITGVILQAGTIAGQFVTIVNESANSITMAAAGTSNVASGTGSVIAANAANTYVWDSIASTPAWYCIGKGA